MRKNDTQPGTIPLPCQCEHILRVTSRYEQRNQWLTEQLRQKDKHLMTQNKQISILVKQLAKELDAKTRQVYMLIERFPRPAVPTAESLRMKNRKKSR